MRYLTCIILSIINWQTFAQTEPTAMRDSLSVKQRVNELEMKSDYEKVRKIPFSKAADSVGLPAGVQLISNRQSDSYRLYTLARELAESSTLSLFDLTRNVESIYQKKSYLLNADSQVPIALGGYRWFFRTNKGKDQYMLHSFHIIPQFKVRIFQNDVKMFGDSSNPVRTPSYIPRLTYYFSFKKLLHSPKISPSLANRSWSSFFGISLFHHSNGQDGNEFFESDKNYQYWRKGDVNVYNGNFSENVSLEVMNVTEWTFGSRVVIPMLRRLLKANETNNKRLSSGKEPKSMAFEAQYAKNRSFLRTSFEWHPPKATTIDLYRNASTGEIMNLYGRHRVNLTFGYSYIPIMRDFIYNMADSTWYQTSEDEAKEMFRFTLNLGYIATPGYRDGNEIENTKVGILNFSKRLNAYVNANWRISGTSSSALFLQVGYYGSDNYNIYFKQSILQVRAGLAFMFFKYPSTEKKKLHIN